MKIFSRLKLLVGSRNETGRIEVDPRWLRDPLSHPDLDAMSPTELADLPFGHARCCAEQAGCPS